MTNVGALMWTARGRPPNSFAYRRIVLELSSWLSMQDELGCREEEDWSQGQKSRGRMMPARTQVVAVQRGQGTSGDILPV